MKIVIDDKIPYIREAIARMGVEAVYQRGSAICSSDVADADALIVRTRTRCDERLLAGSRVRFIATATIGFDHLDTAYLSRAGISWANCPGCNAGSVAQYMLCTLRQLSRHCGLNLRGATLGVVGCGHVGSAVCAVGRKLGMRVLACDPPAPRPGYVAMDVIEREADVVSFHVPLTDDGSWATRHMADAAFFARLERRPFIVNTSRGAVVDNHALKAAMHSGQVRQAVIDTWENEPDIDRELLRNVFIGTPHIAGYSADGKVNADNMALDALCRFFRIPNPGLIAPPPLPAGFRYTGDPLQLYDPMTDSARLKANPELFEELRGNYPLRRETGF